MTQAPGSGPPSGGAGASGSTPEQPRIVIRDKRRLDPETGDVRPVPDTDETITPPVNPYEPTEPPPTGSPDVPTQDQFTEPSLEADQLLNELAERTGDLQRVTAEYANYRRRVDRDRVLLGEVAQERLLLDLLPVLDDVARAEEHGDLTGSFKTVADALGGVLLKAGVETYGAAGDPFDPTLHEAVAHSTSPDVEGPTCVAVLRKGYRRGERVLRTAMVAVADPE